MGKARPGLSRPTGSRSTMLGAGTREIRIRDATGIYRVMHIAKFEEAIYVLLRKKTQVTSNQDKAIAAARFRAVVSARKEKK